MSNASSAVHIDQLYEKWGLDPLVFQSTEARLETRLQDVIVYPDWWYDLLGNVTDTTFRVVVGVRGAGKSALRRLISDRCGNEIFSNKQLKGLVLSIEIDHDITGWVTEPDDLNITLRHFVRHIIELVSVGIVSNIEKDTLKEKLTKAELEQLDRHLSYSLYSYPPEKLDELRRKTRSTMKSVTENEVFKKTLDIFKELTGSPNEDQSVISRNMSLVDTDLPEIIKIGKKVGFDAVYVLVDEIDEYPETQKDNRRAATLLVSLLSSSWLLEQKSLALKFFISESIFNTVPDICEKESKEIRWDRSNHNEPYKLSWDIEEIKNMLVSRLKTYSTGNSVESMSNFCVPSLAERIDYEIAKYSFRSPRYYITFCRNLARAAARQAFICNFKITEQMFEDELLKYCKFSCREQYSLVATNTLLKFNKVEFSGIEFMETLGIEREQADSVLKFLTVPGGLEKYEDLSGSQYNIKDPRLIYLIEAEKKIPGSGLISSN